MYYFNRSHPEPITACSDSNNELIWCVIIFTDIFNYNGYAYQCAIHMIT